MLIFFIVFFIKLIQLKFNLFYFIIIILNIEIIIRVFQQVLIEFSEL